MYIFPTCKQIILYVINLKLRIEASKSSPICMTRICLIEKLLHKKLYKNSVACDIPVCVEKLRSILGGCSASRCQSGRQPSEGWTAAGQSPPKQITPNYCERTSQLLISRFIPSHMGLSIETLK